LDGQQSDISGIGYSLIKKFKQGDLVSWKALGAHDKTYALVTKIMSKNYTNERKLYIAKVITSQGEQKEVNLGILKLESKANLR
tara:strand:- start:6835 stop:7086 length:252 start_codon:yes stop_codon:yes gene_type:complete